eukprot:c12293_g1_i1.p1 GENE.c12293_g1_i1~~c12293_g1_i1.p1  ORF type:complete len:400 (-),score=160.07 c12293_g1_i1:26-1225(-)
MSEEDRKLVYDYAVANGKNCFKEPNGELIFPYIVPSGPYTQLWDWDAVFTGVGLLSVGSGPYLASSMLNFLHQAKDDGTIPGCLTPAGPSKTLNHAKPVIIQGAWIAVQNSVSVNDFLPYRSKMQNILQYWERDRKHKQTGLYVWYNQMESGADNLVLSDPVNDILDVSSPDVMVFLYREHLAYSYFLTAWAKTAEDPQKTEMIQEAAQHTQIAQLVKNAIFQYLWRDDLGYFCAYNVVEMKSIENRTFEMAFPLWETTLMSDHLDIVPRVVAELTKPDMLSPFGIRSTSSSDPQYNNENIITPYSNWQGPIWICSNAILAYALNSYESSRSVALTVANRIVTTLANDLRTTQVWHECYHGETGEGLAAPGFLSWDVMSAELCSNIEKGINPTVLTPPS